jgi:hypothetical protein
MGAMIIRGLIRGLVGLGAMAALTGCELAAGTSGQSAPASVTVASGAVTIAGPSGYCADSSASRDGAEGAFVLLGSCASLAQSESAARPDDPAVLTASVVTGPTDGDDFTRSLPAMTRFLSSSVGRAALSRSGRADNLDILAISTADDVMYIHARDRSEAEGTDVEPEYWRALLAVKGRIVTLSVLGLRENPLPSDIKRALLERFVARVRAANR